MSSYYIYSLTKETRSKRLNFPKCEFSAALVLTMLLSISFFNFAVSFAAVNLFTVIPAVGHLVFDLTNLGIKLQTSHFLVGSNDNHTSSGRYS